MSGMRTIINRIDSGRDEGARPEIMVKLVWKQTDYDDDIRACYGASINDGAHVFLVDLMMRERRLESSMQFRRFYEGHCIHVYARDGKVNSCPLNVTIRTAKLPEPYRVKAVLKTLLPMMLDNRN